MRSEIRWQYGAKNAALHTSVGDRIGGIIKVRSKSGEALSGPCLDLPSGRCLVRVLLERPGSGTIDMQLTSDGGSKKLASETVHFLWRRLAVLELSANLPHGANGVEIRISCRGNTALDIKGIEIALDRELSDEPLHPDRAVGFETSKTYVDKIESGFFQRYLSGPAVMEIGYKGYDGGTVPIVPQAIGVDVGYPGYDGETFPFADRSFDAIYSSHCFEHIAPWKAVLTDWYRMLKIGGFLVIIVPHQLLFERKRHLPSYFNPDHKRYYTSASLLAEVEEALEENGYRIRHLVENDKNFDFSPAPKEGSSGCYEIELVIEKVALPYWHPDDGSVRAYTPAEFKTPFLRTEPWKLTFDLSERDRCLIWGPYVGLAPAKYIAEFYFEPIILSEDVSTPSLVFDIARMGEPIEVLKTTPERTRKMLEEGSISVPFDSGDVSSIFEFRVFSSKPNQDLKIVFKGVNLVYARRPRG